jgi:hypothetical protein
MDADVRRPLNCGVATVACSAARRENVLSDGDQQKPTAISHEDRHRNRVNLIAALGLGVLLLVVYGTVKLFVDHENLQNCVDTGRRNCVDIGNAPREGVRVITR